MAAPRTACLAVLLVLTGPYAATAVTPVQKVITLMKDMLVKADAAKRDEEVKFSAFYQWCGDQTKIRENEIAEATEKIELLKASIEKAAVHIQQLTDRIDELGEDVGRWHKDSTSATEVRDKEREDYQATLTDYDESLAALDQAIAVLKKQAYARSQAEALLQVHRLRLVPLSTKKALMAFLAQPSTEATDAAMPDDQLSIRAPEAAGYSFQSGGVIEMLEKLKDEFASKRRDMMADELTAKHGYEQIMQTLADNIENGEHEISKKTMLRAEVQQAKAEAEGELAQTIADRAEDQKYLDDMTALCAQKKADFESRQELRAGEIEAVKKALEIISSGEVSGAADKHLPSLVQLTHPALAQLRGDQRSPVQARIAEFLAERARASGSRLLSMISQRVAEDPFTKVKKMIKDLIVKLMEEATAETEHKGWCDTEVTTNTQSRNSLSEDIANLNTEIEDLTAEIAQLTQDIEDLTAAINELDKNMATATAERTASKEKNAETVADAKAAQTAVEQAIAVLKEFYAKSAEATALAQQTPAEDAPETFDKPYKGMLPEGGSVIDFLEVILTDFARLEAETATAEATEQDQYDNFMFESKKDKALKENDIKHKSEKRTRDESALTTANEELASTQESLDKAVAYYEKLKPKCIDSGITYEERVKRREEEIQSLQEALKILAGEDIPDKLDRSGDVN